MEFIVIDGLDGSGKDTQVKLLSDSYKKAGKKVKVCLHPSSETFFGKKAKKALLKEGKLNHIKATVFFGLDVIKSINRYYYFSRDADILIFSRYIMSVVYLPNVINVIIYKIVSFLLPTSSYMFFLDVTPEESLKRIGSRGEDVEMFENKKELEKARNKSKNVLYEWIVINADNSIEKVHEEIKDNCPYL